MGGIQLEDADRLVNSFNKIVLKFTNLKAKSRVSLRGFKNMIDGALVAHDRIDSDYNLSIIASDENSIIVFSDGKVSKEKRESKPVDPNEPIKKKRIDIGLFNNYSHGAVGTITYSDGNFEDVYLIHHYGDEGKVTAWHETANGDRVKWSGDDQEWYKPAVDGGVDLPDELSLGSFEDKMIGCDDDIDKDINAEEWNQVINVIDAEERVVDMIKDKLARAEEREEMEQLDFATVTYICNKYLSEGQLTEDLAKLYDIVRDKFLHDIKNPPGKPWGDVRLVMDENGQPARTHEVKCRDKETKFSKFDILVSARNVETAGKIAAKALKDSPYFVDSIRTL